MTLPGRPSATSRWTLVFNSPGANANGVKELTIAALLLASGQLCQAVMLDRELDVEGTAQVQAANRIVRAGQSFYLLTDSGVECLSTDGTSQWQQSLSARPQGLLADRKQLLVFCGNTVQVLTPPEAETSASGNP